MTKHGGILKHLFLVLALAVPTFVQATSQAPDVVIVKGTSYSLFTNPLTPYLFDHPGLLPESAVEMSNNWRGYIAEWEFRSGQLVLVDVSVLFRQDPQYGVSARNRYQSVFSEMFPHQETVLADWYTGHLIIPTGKLVNYVHSGYGSTYTSYAIARVANGTITKIWSTDLKGFKSFREAQFNKFRKTDEYAKLLAMAMEDSTVAILADPFGDGELSKRKAERYLRSALAEHYLSVVFEKPPDERPEDGGGGR